MVKARSPLVIGRKGSSYEPDIDNVAQVDSVLSADWRRPESQREHTFVKTVGQDIHYLRFWACSLNLGNRKNVCSIVIFATITSLSNLRFSISSTLTSIEGRVVDW